MKYKDVSRKITRKLGVDHGSHRDEGTRELCLVLPKFTRVRTEVLQSRLPASPVYRALHIAMGMGLSRTWLAQAATSHHPIAHRGEEVDYRL